MAGWEGRREAASRRHKDVDVVAEAWPLLPIIRMTSSWRWCSRLFWGTSRLHKGCPSCLWWDLWHHLWHRLEARDTLELSSLAPGLLLLSLLNG